MKLNKTLCRLIIFAFLSGMTGRVSTVLAQIPIRSPHASGYVSAKELPDGLSPSTNENGNFIIGPTHTAAPESIKQENVPQGTVYHFTVESKDSKIYPGIARDPNTFGTSRSSNPC